MDKNTISQVRLVEKHLNKKGSITSWEAFEKYGITRLSAVIYILRQDGQNIKSISTTKKNRYGHSVTFSTYTLEP